MNSNHLDTIKKFQYIPVGLGNDTFSNQWLDDRTGDNISYKNKYYGEYTFHYWIWKNYIEKVEDKWIGFCQYRKFWSLDTQINKPNSLKELQSLVLKEIPKKYEDFDAILGEPFFVDQLKLMKFLKRGLKMILLNPLSIIDKRQRNIRFHFNMWHGKEFLDEAIKLLDYEDKKDFNNFINTNNSFNPHNMFICKSKKTLQKYYEKIFPWLDRCEKLFKHKTLSGYGQTRIYGFLAERFMSYWFQKNTRYKTMPIIFYDIK